MQYDVLVAGGGPAGMSAAMQSAAAGAKTLLLERSSMLGGTTNAAGVNFPGIFHAWGRQIIDGYGWKLVAQCVAESGGTLPDFSMPPAANKHWMHQVRVDRALYTMLCDEHVTRTGAEVLFHAMPAKVSAQSDGWLVTICGKSGLQDVAAHCLVDCTGDANLVALAGGALLDEGPDKQPGTYVCTATGYDLARLDMDAIEAAFRAALASGEVTAHDAGWDVHTPVVQRWLRAHGENVNHIPGIDGRDSWGRTQMELAGRKSILRMYRFLRRQPGLENLQIAFLAPQCGVRETVRVVGDAMITAADYTSGRVWPDALCHSFYPIDLHTADGSGLKKIHLAAEIVPTVPRGALLPKGLTRIAVGGRCVSSDRDANSALRVQGSAMAMGQAAGAMAALSAKQGVDMRALDLEDIRGLLRVHGAIVPAV
ncbi:MAG: FAD-dependent oxidoreductase [Kiritimatiellia bacterium]